MITKLCKIIATVIAVIMVISAIVVAWTTFHTTESFIAMFTAILTLVIPSAILCIILFAIGEILDGIEGLGLGINALYRKVKDLDESKADKNVTVAVAASNGGSSWRCKNCGTKNLSLDRFCKDCGTYK